MDTNYSHKKAQNTQKLIIVFQTLITLGFLP